MHLLVRENRTLDEQDSAEDLGLPGADIVVLSFTESDLLGLRHAEQQMRAEGVLNLPSVQVTGLARLRHPMSIDLYVESTLQEARCVVVRLLGGLDYWRYGAEEVAAWARAQNVPVVFLPGHSGGTGQPVGGAADDDRLAALSHGVSAEQRQRLNGFFAQGGPSNMRAALRLMAVLAGSGEDDGAQPEHLPAWGPYRTYPARREGSQNGGAACSATIVFYRAHLQASDMAGMERLAEVLAQQGCAVELLFVTSLKDQAVARGVTEHLRRTKPDVVLNATCFSARGAQGFSPLDGAGAPVLQVLQPGSTQALWAESSRGLGRSDLAMQVVLPELDGTIATFPISFRQESAPGLPAQRVAYEPGIHMVAARAMAWARLRQKPAVQKHVGIVLSDYPGAGLEQAGAHVAHAVGLDGFASLHNILLHMQQQGYATGPQPVPTAEELVHLMAHKPAQPVLSVAEYQSLSADLDADFMASVAKAWGPPEQDAAVKDGTFCLRYATLGTITVAIQPDRGKAADRKAIYHDPDTPPCHAYVAFYLWLRRVQKLDALVHLGTHGTLEWLPGKAAGLSPACAPAVLTGDLPVIYPFIVNNPGEAAAARRRLGAVTIGHMTPPVMQANLSGDMRELERLIDEYAEADGLDPRRGGLLRADILERAARTGVLAESGVHPGELDETEALARLDAYLCDVKDLQIRDGLHVFGQTAPRSTLLVQTIAQACGRQDDPVFVADVARRIDQCGTAEMCALLGALAGQPVAAGPAGAPTRGRVDVLPTGRNLFTVDPRALPTPSAMVLATRMEQLLLTRHLQEHGEPLTRLVMDMWGSASLRTGGEDLALALRLMGVEVQRAEGTGHVCGFEVIPLPVLDRPRVDVTLRISGLFRDAFADQIALFDQAVTAVADRREPEDWNPLAAQAKGLEGDARKRATARIFGAAAGTYGTGIEDHLLHGTWESRADLGAAWLEGSSWMYGGGRDGTRDEAALSALLGQAETVLHVQDNAENDLLESPDIAAHEGGLAAATYLAGGAPSVLHGDTSRPQSPRLRATEEEVARIVRGRLANPQWIAGMQRHGYAGAAELARGLDALHGFAATMPQRFDRQFDLVFAATLGNAECDGFLRKANPAAREAMRQRFAEAMRRGLWHPRGNSVACVLDGNE
ncbi:cobaltochelatase subunit CobN [Acetobacter ghanensis]|uniref:Cobaltochelatase CobN n=1 Tax=Acetobacter ghanensis TaxID=431306 RepID=A0A0U5F1D9_9PROT|nr:cobaltochelatase subunit CobN [Acetobacter ghanensis]NHO39582.1 cobaltochelatase subunit CobN [Acetobacter ghanensis]GBQ46015.1 cobaltochelatase subunit CobN [Acetobacter ghanensis DSM 18895]CEF54813.1 cobaltochelatase CobN [Acetobacter ghanensis]